MANDSQIAQRSSLSQEGRGLDPSFYQPKLGQISYTNDLDRPKNSAEILKNLHYIAGVWTDENTGWSKHRTVNPGGGSGTAGNFNSGGEFLDFGVHTLADGTKKFLFQVGTKVYRYDPTGTPATELEVLLFTAGSATKIPCMRSFSPSFFIYANGYDQPQKWDGTTWAALTGWPVTIGSITYTKPQLCEPFAGRMAFARFDGDQFSIVLSEFDDPEGYTATGTATTRAGVFGIKSFMGPVRAMKAFKLSNDSNEEVLVIGCENGIAVITGSDADTFELVNLTNEFGMYSNRVWVQLDNDLYFLATDGIRRFSNVANNANLLTGSLSRDVQDVINRQNKTYMERAFAVHHPSTLEVQFWFPLDSFTHNTSALVMNYGALYDNGIIPIYSTKETPIENLASAATLRSPSCGILFNGTFYGGGYNGFLQDWYSTNKYDDEIMRFRILLPLISAGTPAQTTSVRKFEIICDGGSQEFDVSGAVYDTTQQQQTRRRTLLTQTKRSVTTGSTILGSWILGSGEFPSEGIQNIEFVPPGSGRYWQVDIQGNTSDSAIKFVGLLAILIIGGTRG